MKKLYIISILLLTCSCIKQVKPANHETTVNNFFARCNSDIKNAAETISSKKLISALFHLNRMNNGGSYYYILEKDATTEMLNKLTTYKYSECILITNEGKIIYAMYDDSLLGKSIYGIPGKPFNSLVEKSLSNMPAISDSIIYITENGDRDNLTFTYPVFEGSEQKGVMITSVPTKYLKEELPKNTYIVDQSGVIKYHPDTMRYNQTDEFFILKNPSNISKTANGEIHYHAMNFETISWYIATVYNSI